MYKGEPTKGVEFFNFLFESDDFSAELGRVALAAGRLEAEMMLYLIRNGVKENISRLTLGQLIKIGEKNKLLDKNLTNALEHICMQRNYLTHNIYALFVELIDETVLERSNLLDTDVLTYVDRAWQLRINLSDLANIISKH
jgi:hypothetical protein